MAKHCSNIICKFADDNHLILISNRDETSCREEVGLLKAWCSDNNLSLNASKTKEIFVDYKKTWRGGHAPIHINGVEVQNVKSYKFLGVHISDDLSWSHHTDTASESSSIMSLLPAEAKESWC